MRDLSWPHDPELTEEEAVSIAADLLNRFNLPHVILDSSDIRERIRALMTDEEDEELVELVKGSTEWLGAAAECMEETGVDMLDDAVMEYDADRNR